MNWLKLFILLSLCFFISTEATAYTLSPDAAFTIRLTTDSGPFESMDNEWGNGGFEGYLTNYQGSQVDWTFAEFSLAAITQPVQSATLNWDMYGDNADTVFLNYYDGDGSSSTNEWNTVTTPYTSFAAGSSSYVIDITALINSNLGSMDFIGFRWTIDPFPYQAFMDGQQPPIIDYTVSQSVPEPTTMLLLGLGLIGLAGVRKRMGT